MTAQDRPLPNLREDLQIVKGGVAYSGARYWVVLDPLRNRFFRISYEMFQLLSVWRQSSTTQGLVTAVQQAYGRDVPNDEIESALRLLNRNFFFDHPLSGNWRELCGREQYGQTRIMHIFHNYVFFKVPLLRPEPFIRAAWPFVSVLFSSGFLLCSALAGFLGLYLVSQQWETFIGTFPYIFSLEGAAVSLLSVLFVKSLHELAHGFAAYRYGCRVPTMGVAFILLAPLLYTDVTDAWRLRSRRSRLLIDAAGITAEISVGAIALLLWVFLPDGPFRSAAFLMATTSWIVSVLVNLNPFMRFDGYYIFSDFLGLENLQPRAFAHLRWRIRRILFNLDHEAPEAFPPRLSMIVTVYAICTVIYRLLLYLGIALLVYSFVVKIVGVLMFVFEIGFFIIRPIWVELTEWYRLRSEIKVQRRTYVSLFIIAFLVVLVFLPLSTSVRAPALLMPETFVRIFPSEAARVDRIHFNNGQTVDEGEVLFTLVSPALEEELKRTSIQIALAERRVARIGANVEELSDRGVNESALRSFRAQWQGLQERKAKLTIRAPFAGRVYDLNPDIYPGRWISRREPLAFISSQTVIVARGYVSADPYARLRTGAQGVFIPNDISLLKSDARLTSIAVTVSDRIDIPQLTSLHGGAIAATASADGDPVPHAAYYQVVAIVDNDTSNFTQTVPGVLLLKGTRQSLAASAWRQILKVLIRESGT